MLDRLKQFLPASSEGENAYNGVLSTTTEWHSLAVGLGAGLATGVSGNPAPIGAAAAFALGRVPTSDIGHLRDVTREPAYAFGGMAIGFVAGTFLL
jgi:hypothetical protein